MLQNNQVITLSFSVDEKTDPSIELKKLSENSGTLSLLWEYQFDSWSYDVFPTSVQGKDTGVMTLIGVTILLSKFCFLNNHFHKKESAFIGEMTDCRLEARKKQGELRTTVLC